eukprot:2796275-Pleurochrysis_carterae.AAC.4
MDTHVRGRRAWANFGARAQARWCVHVRVNAGVITREDADAVPILTKYEIRAVPIACSCLWR